MLFSWWCVWDVYGAVFLDSFLGGNRFLQCNDAKMYFVFAAALLHKGDLVMSSMQKMKFTV